MPRIPRCRVCGCTDDRACDGGCAWIRVEAGSPPLCSACAGTADDAREAFRRILRLMPTRIEIARIARAALRRCNARKTMTEVPW